MKISKTKKFSVPTFLIGIIVGALCFEGALWLFFLVDNEQWSGGENANQDIEIVRELLGKSLASNESLFGDFERPRRTLSERRLLDLYLIKADSAQLIAMFDKTAEIPDLVWRHRVREKIVQRVTMSNPKLAVELSEKVDQYARRSLMQATYLTWEQFDSEQAFSSISSLDIEIQPWIYESLLRSLRRFSTSITLWYYRSYRKSYGFHELVDNTIEEVKLAAIYENPQAEWNKTAQGSRSGSDLFEELQKIALIWAPTEGVKVIEAISRSKINWEMKNALIQKLIVSHSDLELTLQAIFTSLNELQDPSVRQSIAFLVESWEPHETEVLLKNISTVEPIEFQSTLHQIALRSKSIDD